MAERIPVKNVYLIAPELPEPGKKSWATLVFKDDAGREWIYKEGGIVWAVQSTIPEIPAVPSPDHDEKED